MNHMLESILIRKISTTSDNITLKAESEDELKSLLKKVKEESGKVGLKLDAADQHGCGPGNSASLGLCPCLLRRRLNGF